MLIGCSLFLGGKARFGPRARRGWGGLQLPSSPSRSRPPPCLGAPGPPAGGRAGGRVGGSREPPAARMPRGATASARRGTWLLLSSPKPCVVPAAGLGSTAGRGPRFKSRGSHRLPVSRKQDRRLSVPVLNVFWRRRSRTGVGVAVPQAGKCRLFRARLAAEQRRGAPSPSLARTGRQRLSLRSGSAG